jgi:hypothetical protein
MVTFKGLIKVIDMSLNGGSMKAWIRACGLRHPAQVTHMYLSGESADYIAAAVLVVNQVGE